MGRPWDLFDHVIRPLQERRWDREAEGLPGLEVDDEFELRRLLDGEIGGLGSLEDLVHIRRGPAGEVRDARAVCHQPSRAGELPEAVDRRKSRFCRGVDDLDAVAERQWIR